MDERRATFDNVVLVGDTGRALVCMIGERKVVIPLLRILPGTAIVRPGDRGKLVLPTWYAMEQGLL